ncbi:JPT2 isoform 11 [Pan troglodytes]|uniref:JPT2 isoform 11 n=1 Tax=Pan troglodytes TaxID=9598 RepID=A0A2J8J7V0_PANTR|nr:JPT2 isoform 11 [Pan troglodytes]
MFQVPDSEGGRAGSRKWQLLTGSLASTSPSLLSGQGPWAPLQRSASTRLASGGHEAPRRRIEQSFWKSRRSYSFQQA